MFVLSAGWRSGSTALQRLVVSGGEAFIWGEPFPTTRLLPRATRILLEVPVADDGPTRVLATGQLSSGLSTRWIATTNPDRTAVAAGVRALLETTYWQPLIGSSFSTWGTKEVVATTDQVQALRVLFPDARFVAVVRDPIAAYRSFRKFIVSAVATKPGSGAKLTEVRGPVGYGRIWREMAQTFRGLAGEPNFHVFRYEDIVGDARFPTLLGKKLGMDLDPDAWSSVVGSTRVERAGVVERAELSILQRITVEERARWGYAR